MSILEAMAMGRAVLVADARGSRELVQPDCGWIYPIGDTHALACLIQNALDNPDERSLRARRGREKVRANYGWPAVQETLIRVYQRLGVVFPEAGEATVGWASQCANATRPTQGVWAECLNAPS